MAFFNQNKKFQKSLKKFLLIFFDNFLPYKFDFFVEIFSVHLDSYSSSFQVFDREFYDLG
jgi:hypothetical protein